MCVCVSYLLINKFQGSLLLSVQGKKPKARITHIYYKNPKELKFFCLGTF